MVLTRPIGLPHHFLLRECVVLCESEREGETGRGTERIVDLSICRGVKLDPKDKGQKVAELQPAGGKGRGDHGVWDWSITGACCSMSSVCAALHFGFFPQVSSFLLPLVLKDLLDLHSCCFRNQLGWAC